MQGSASRNNKRRMIHWGWRMKVQEEMQGIWRDLRALGGVGKGAGAQEVLSSVLPTAENGEGRNSQQVNSWLQTWLHQWNFWGFG